MIPGIKSAQFALRARVVGGKLSSVLFVAAVSARCVSSASSVKMTHTQSVNGSTIVLAPSSGKHDSVVVFMHGLGDSGHGWIDAVEDVFAPALKTTKFMVPSAGSMPVTVNGGYVMPAWYDITALSADRADQPCTGIEASRDFIKGLLEAEASKHGVPWSKMVLAGFSQGGALSLYTGLTCGHKLAGIACLSGYLPVPDRVASSTTDDSKTIPIRMFHGDSDEVVRLEWAHKSKDKLEAIGCKDVNLTVYGGLPHSASMKELSHVLSFLIKVLQ